MVVAILKSHVEACVKVLNEHLSHDGFIPEDSELSDIFLQINGLRDLLDQGEEDLLTLAQKFTSVNEALAKVSHLNFERTGGQRTFVFNDHVSPIGEKKKCGMCHESETDS